MATSEQWTASRFDWSRTDTEAMDGHPLTRCVMELHARVEALEAAANDRQQDEDNEQAMPDAPPADGLVQRVALRLANENNDSAAHIWEPDARAAIYEVATWMREHEIHVVAAWLEQEAKL